jgi:uncharacterized iron-regulated protein
MTDFDTAMDHLEGALQDGVTATDIGTVLAYAAVGAEGDVEALLQFVKRARAPLLAANIGQELDDCLSGFIDSLEQWIDPV